LEARARGYHVHGIDYSDDAVAITNQKLGFEAVRVAKTSVAEFPKNSFDVCILADVIEHVRDPRSFLTQIWHMLDNQAVVFIATPNAKCILSRVSRPHWIEFKQEHLLYFSHTTITRLLSQEGYVDIEIKRGQKVLTPAYIFGYFDKFPVPVLSSAIEFVRNFTPSKLHETQIKISGGGLDIYASKP
jgi:SAM-dependent methyltransferase